MHYVYIIYSQTVKKYYVGESAFPQNRISEHNTGKYSAASTKIAKNWSLARLITCTQRIDALKIEKYIKSMKSRKFIELLINDSDFYQKFKEIIFDKYAIKID